ARMECRQTMSLIPRFVFCPANATAGPLTQSAPRGEPISIAQPFEPSSTNSVAPNATTAPTTAPNTNTDAPTVSKADHFIVTGFYKLAAFSFDAGSDAPVSPDNARDASRKIMAQI